jgi:predicted nucleotidyltransferase
MPEQEVPQNPIDTLAELTESSWPNIKSAREYTRQKRQELKLALTRIDTDDTSIVAFGSLARDEATPGSDIDWTLLVDGIADPLHATSAQEIIRRLDIGGFRKPGREGTFGNLAFSHQIVHWIGGEDDSNANTTRRILLLLESKPLGQPEAWDRIINNVIDRYLTEDRGLWDSKKNRRVPLFLFNDIARYWRIMVVDFAYKQRARGNEGYALRNIKLGLSRKLIYVSGMLACFSCSLDFTEDRWKDCSKSRKPQFLIDHLRTILGLTPLEILASNLLRFRSAKATSKLLFDSYDRFLGVLADNTLTDKGKLPRIHLEELSIEELDNDKTYQTARKIRRDFGHAIDDLFLKPGSELYDLTMRYGVF